VRILCVGNFSSPTWDGSIADEIHIANALEGLGHEVVRWHRDKIFARTGIREFDFCLIAQWDGYDDEGLRCLPHPLVYWAFDRQDQNQNWHKRLIEYSDIYLSKRIADSIYSNWRWLCDFAPEFLVRSPVKRVKDIDVLFTGSYLPWATERTETLKLVDDHFNLTIHSVTPDQWKERGFKHVYGPAMDDALIELTADRVAQAICCGGFVLHRWQPLSEAFFHQAIGYYYGKDQVLEEIQYWLDHEEDREKLAADAYDVSEQFKVYQRVGDMLTIVKEKL